MAFNNAYMIGYYAMQMPAMMEEEFPPGLSSEEKIAHLQGKLARQRYEHELAQRRIRELESENANLRQECRRREEPPISPAIPPSIVSYRIRYPSKSSCSSSDITGQSSDLTPVEKRKFADHVRLGIAVELNSLRTELGKIREDTKTATNKFYENLKQLRHSCRTNLDPKFMLNELVPNSAKTNGYVLIQEQHISGLLRVVSDSMTVIASNMAAAASRDSVSPS